MARMTLEALLRLCASVSERGAADGSRSLPVVTTTTSCRASDARTAAAARKLPDVVWRRVCHGLSSRESVKKRRVKERVWLSLSLRNLTWQLPSRRRLAGVSYCLVYMP